MLSVSRAENDILALAHGGLAGGARMVVALGYRAFNHLAC